VTLLGKDVMPWYVAVTGTVTGTAANPDDVIFPAVMLALAVPSQVARAVMSRVCASE